LLRDARHNAGGTTPPLHKRPVQQRLRQMLRLPFRFPLLRTQAFKLLDDAREFLLQSERRKWSIIILKKTRRDSLLSCCSRECPCRHISEFFSAD
jgi:hypothetical protein